MQLMVSALLWACVWLFSGEQCVRMESIGLNKQSKYRFTLILGLHLCPFLREGLYW